MNPPKVSFDTRPPPVNNNDINVRTKSFARFPQKNDIQTTVTLLSPPFGSTRLSICTLFTVLLESGNSDIIKAWVSRSISLIKQPNNMQSFCRICETDFFNTLLKMFKQYCWNNILHNQVKKCFTYAFSAFDNADGNPVTPSALQTHVSDIDCGSGLLVHVPNTNNQFWLCVSSSRSRLLLTVK